jgi:myotubularin-related protein 6/7/8
MSIFKDLQLSTRTGSYWSYINERRDDFINAFYQPNKFDQISVDIRPQSIVLWRSMYNRFDTGILPNESIDNVAIATLDHIGVLEMQLAALQTVSFVIDLDSL